MNTDDTSRDDSWDDAWWAEPLDIAELKRRGFTYQEVRELERIWQAAIPPELKRQQREAFEKLGEAFEKAFQGLRDALDSVFADEEDEDGAST
jgi:hypothetical protein